MTVPEPKLNFETSVELDFAAGRPDPKTVKCGSDITLVARFRDFLGEPTKETGRITLSTSQGELSLPNGGASGSEIVLEAGEVPIGDTGEFPIIFRPGNEFGKVEVAISCDLGESKLEIVVPAPSGFALAEMMESIIYAFLVAIVIRILFFQTFWIPSGSMEPTLFEGDRIIANKLIYRLREPQRGEVIIFRVFQPPRRGMPGRLTLDEAIEAAENLQSRGLAIDEKDEDEDVAEFTVEVQDYIKRVVGLPGDVIEIVDGEIYLNGEVLIENVSTRPPDYNRYGPVTVPPGEVFVLGDNRSNSQDSHVIGTIPMRNIEGRAEVVFWPPNRIGMISQGK